MTELSSSLPEEARLCLYVFIHRTRMTTSFHDFRLARRGTLLSRSLLHEQLPHPSILDPILIHAFQPTIFILDSSRQIVESEFWRTILEFFFFSIRFNVFFFRVFFFNLIMKGYNCQFKYVISE